MQETTNFKDAAKAAMRQSPYPLEGVTVLDLGQIYQGPYCGLLLALAGATVIKVEPPAGDPVRSRADSNDGSSLALAMLNGNKKGIVLDLKQQAGKEVFLRLVDQADVLLENYAPGVMDRLGLGANVLCERNPRLIFASASGYGSSGPYRDFLAMDLTIQAMGGMMSVTGDPQSEPLKAGPAICDFLGGAHFYGAILTALYRRERTGRGGVVETAMLDQAYPTLASNLSAMHQLGGLPPRSGNRHGGLAMAPYNVYPASDGHIAVICVRNDHWQALARVMGREDLLDDPRFATHATRSAIMEEVDALVADWTRQHTRKQVFDLSRQHHFPAAPVRDMQELSEDPHLHERGALQRVEHPDLGQVVLPHSPLRFAGQEPLPLRPSPRLGEHTSAVLRERLGLTPQALAELQAQGAFGATRTPGV